MVATGLAGTFLLGYLTFAMRVELCYAFYMFSRTSRFVALNPQIINNFAFTDCAPLTN